MKIIQEQDRFIQTVLGNQKVISNVKYRLLNYCIVKNHDNNVLLFNNMTKELLLLSEEETAQIKADFLDSTNSFIKTLIEKWFCVPFDNDDLMLSRQITTLSRQFSNNKSITSYTILTTTDCNARCFYCYEAGTKKIFMTPQTALDVAKYIVANSGGKPVVLHWFGGEPLYNQEPINIITKYLDENNVEYHSEMITNGYLFDDRVICKAINQWKLKRLQIPLDGTEKIYNRVKNFIYDDTNPFQRIIKNIETLLKANVLVRIRLNIDNYNIDDIKNLVNLLYDKFGGQNKFSIYPHLLFENVGLVKKESSKTERQKAFEMFAKLQDYIDSLGILSQRKTLSKTIELYHCMADNVSSVLISPEGKLGNCELFVDSDFFGDIYSNKFESWHDYSSTIKMCEKCAYQPSCIKLERCPSNNHECCDYEQKRNIENLEKRILNTFSEYLKSVEASDKEL